MTNHKTETFGSKRFKSIDKGKKVYISCDEGIFVEICQLMSATGHGLVDCRGYDPFRDKNQYDRYLLFEQGADKDFLVNMIRMVSTMPEALEKIEETVQDVVLFLESQKNVPHL